MEIHLSFLLYLFIPADLFLMGVYLINGSTKTLCIFAAALTLTLLTAAFI